MIPKREHNPQLSLMGNMVLDLVDFKDRVKPMSHDVSMLENTKRYQKGQTKQSERIQVMDRLNNPEIDDEEYEALIDRAAVIDEEAFMLAIEKAGGFKGSEAAK